jgi:hydroxymethylpyrimidine kinase/phosphomethylpyrimidine kinase
LLSRALTVAGFDPSGGAGVLADARTFLAFGFEAAAVITSITFQNSTRVFGVRHQTGEVIREQLTPLLVDERIVCAKTGMLPTKESVEEVARFFRQDHLPPPVVDPVLMSSSGTALIDEDAIPAMISEVFSLAAVITPNIPEAERLTGERIVSEADMRDAASKLRATGARAVLVKGGHLNDRRGGNQKRNEAVDVLDNEGSVSVFRGEFFPRANLHGSGCILSSAIAAGLGRGMTLEDSISKAKEFVSEALRKTFQ